MHYFTKEWYETCQNTGWYLNMQVSKNAEVFSEEYYHDLFLRRRRAFVKQQKEVAEIGQEGFDKEAVEAQFLADHEYCVKRMQENLPEEILEQVADIRVLALDIAAKEVKQKLKVWCEENTRQMHAVQKKYWEEVCPELREAVGAEIQKEFSFHASKIIALEQNEKQFILKMNPCFSDVHTVIFKNYRILEQEGYILNADWIYEEVHPVEGGNEYHGLLWKENGKLGYLTIFAKEIEFLK